MEENNFSNRVKEEIDKLIKEYLTNHLKISLNESDSYDSREITATLHLDGNIISESYPVYFNY